MKVTWDMIDPQYHTVGMAMRTLLRYRDERSLARMGKLSRLAPRGRRSRRVRGDTVRIERRDGGELLLRRYCRRERGTDVPGVLWIHGGGYAMGSATMAIPYAEKLLGALDCVVIAPEYTLSIDRPYPAALEDCYEALFWMKTHAGELGVRDDQLFVGGDSAGGGLTAAVTLYARDRGEVNIAFQTPLYPMLDDRMETASMRDNDAPMWNERANRLAWKLHLGDLYGGEDVPVYAAPGRETDLRDLPPAFSFVGELDPFLDETARYFADLEAAGVPAELHTYPGCFHAFDQASGKADKSVDAIGKLLAAYRRAAETCFAPQTAGE